MPSCAIVDLMYVLIGLFYFLLLPIVLFLPLGNNLLCMPKGIMFPFLPVVALYSTNILTLFDSTF